MSQRTLVLIKPDAVRRRLVGEVLSRFEAKGLTIVAMEQRLIDAAQADAHYAEHVERDFYPPLRDFVTSGPLVALVLEGDEAIEVVRAINGATDGRKAAPGHHPRRPLAVQPREPRPRLRLPGVSGPRDRALVPRPLASQAVTSATRASACLRGDGLTFTYARRRGIPDRALGVRPRRTACAGCIGFPVARGWA